VYEPGQFALRGSILDVFSYSNELAYRIDFFGDDIESIRTFNVETQLSEEASNPSSSWEHSMPTMPRRESLLDYVNPTTVLLCHDPEWLVEAHQSHWGETLSDSTLIAEEGDKDAMQKIVDVDHFCSRLWALSACIDFHYSAESLTNATPRLHFALQLHKVSTTRILSSSAASFKDFLARGYR
jgi:transcription-repair coupling factor (superfamily II helicase)